MYGTGSKGTHSDTDVRMAGVEDEECMCVHVTGAEWSFERCSITSCGGIAVLCEGGAQVSAATCTLGGQGVGERMASDGIVAREESIWALEVPSKIYFF
jgi:hypothetical protein